VNRLEVAIYRETCLQSFLLNKSEFRSLLDKYNLKIDDFIPDDNVLYEKLKMYKLGEDTEKITRVIFEAVIQNTAEKIGCDEHDAKLIALASSYQQRLNT